MNSSAALIVLAPAESKRLIAKSIAAMPEVIRARQEGRLIIGNGTTNAFVAEEVFGGKVAKVPYAAGIVNDGKLDVTDAKTRLLPYVSVKGRRVDTPWTEVLRDFEADDVFIKGANAVDPFGIPGVLVGDTGGGTVGAFFGVVSARGCHLIVPVGLEKMVPSVTEAAHHAGIGRFAKAMGWACGLIPLPAAKVVTEIQALRLLAGVDAWHLASGGIAGSEGSVVIAVEGEPQAVEKAYSLAASVKGERAVAPE